MPATTRTLLNKEERTASILRGAAAAFAHTGFASTSMEDVAGEVDVFCGMPAFSHVDFVLDVVGYFE